MIELNTIEKRHIHIRREKKSDFNKLLLHPLVPNICMCQVHYMFNHFFVCSCAKKKEKKTTLNTIKRQQFLCVSFFK